MGKRDKRIDAYIHAAGPFAQPVLEHLRELVHRTCPDVEETMKWSFPHFQYHGILCSMASFKQHLAFSFWKGSLMKDPQQVFETADNTGMGHLGKIRGMQDLPSDAILAAYIKEAMKLNEAGQKVQKTRSTGKKELDIPGYFQEALDKAPGAMETFEALNFSGKRDYVSWITEAKTEETRARRLQTSLEWLSEGKSRNWKYERK